MEQTTHGQRWHKNNAQSMQLMSFPTTSAVNWLWLEIFSIAVSFVHSFLWRAFFCPFLFGFCWLLYCVFYNFYSFCSCSRMVVCCVEMQFVFFARCLPVSTLVLHCGHFFFLFAMQPIRSAPHEMVHWWQRKRQKHLSETLIFQPENRAKRKQILCLNGTIANYSAT